MEKLLVDGSGLLLQLLRWLDVRRVACRVEGIQLLTAVTRLPWPGLVRHHRGWCSHVGSGKRKCETAAGSLGGQCGLWAYMASRI
jgi:hypothetical protein